MKKVKNTEKMKKSKKETIELAGMIISGGMLVVEIIRVILGV